MFPSVRVAACFAISLTLAGCASAQLNFNTLEIASTVESLQTKQVLYNISKFIDDPDAIPDQIAVSSGTVSTTNSITPNISNALARANVFSAAASATKSVTQSEKSRRYRSMDAKLGHRPDK